MCREKDPSEEDNQRIADIDDLKAFYEISSAFEEFNDRADKSLFSVEAGLK